MKIPILILCALCASSCLATSGDLERATAEIAERVAVVARSAEESAQAVRDAYARGELTYAELQQRLQDIRAATLEAGEAVTKEVIDSVRETIESRPEVIAQTAGNAAGALIPGPLGQLAEMLILAGGAYAAASRKAKKDAEDAVWDLRMERTKEHLAKAEAKQ
jgi:hypothetical protein